MSKSQLDRARLGALDRIERSRRLAIASLVAAGIVEALILVAVMFMIDPDSRTDKVIFLCSCLVFCPLLLGLLALRSYIDLTAQKILAAIESVIGERTMSDTRTKTDSTARE